MFLDRLEVEQRTLARVWNVAITTLFRDHSRSAWSGSHTTLKFDKSVFFSDLKVCFFSGIDRPGIFWRDKPNQLGLVPNNICPIPRSSKWFGEWSKKCEKLKISVLSDNFANTIFVHLFGIQEIGEHRFPDSQRLKFSFFTKESLFGVLSQAALLGYEWNRMIKILRICSLTSLKLTRFTSGFFCSGNTDDYLPYKSLSRDCCVSK